MSAPDKIYLQWADEDYDEITWCVDQIDDTDVEYSRVTLEELAALRRVAEAARPLYSDEEMSWEEAAIALDVLKQSLVEYDKCRAA